MSYVPPTGQKTGYPSLSRTRYFVRPTPLALRVPVRLDEHFDAPQVAPSVPRCPPAGIMAVVSEFPGGGYVVPMHRTQSLDYAVVLSGEIVLGLDGGEEKVLGVGDVIVQQGANHIWVNRAAGPCRVLFVMIGAEKVVLHDGTVLDETVLGKK
jgi:quercetin dioxygenase-like cupin family protein